MKSCFYRYSSLFKSCPLGLLLLIVTFVGCTPKEEVESGLSIHSLSSSSGSTRGGTQITINGSHFDLVENVSFGTLECTGLVVNSSTSITCTTPAHVAGTIDVTANGADGQSNSVPYTFIALAPTVSSISPTGGQLAGGTTLVLTGSNFFSGATVKVGGSICTNVTVVSSNVVQCSTPAKTAGAYSVIATNDDGLSVTAASTYTYRAAPTITSFSPTFGTASGGTLLTITGTGFLTGTTANVNYYSPVSCTSPIILSSTTMTCLTGVGVPGAYNVYVSNSDTQYGLSSTSFTYSLAPAPTAVSPSAGALAGGTVVTITGSNFVSGATVKIGGTACTPVVFVSANSLTCTTAAKTVGAYSVEVTNPSTLAATLSNAYSYQAAPTVTSVSPSGGQLAGGTTITITGTGFKAALTAKVGGVTCTSPTYISSTSMTCITPVGTAGAKSIAVTNADTQTVTLAGAYTYRAAPTITSISPSAGALAGGTTITITGTGFLTSPTVKIGGVTCTSPTYVSATSATCITPSGTAGTPTVVITNSDSQPSVSAVSYTYRAAPTVTSVSPLGGTAAVATPITITGTGFISGATVSISGSACTGVTVVSLTSITCTTPALAAGVKTVTVTNSDTQLGTHATGYTFLSAPTVTSFSPTVGVLTGGTLVTITGTGFFTGAIAKIGGTACTTTTYISSTSLTCVTPASALGPNSVSVLNINAQTGTAIPTFESTETPTVINTSPSLGPIGGGTTITISGTGFLSGATVDLGLNSCTSPVVVNETTITCITPLTLISGLTAITVTNTNTQTDTLASGFLYLLPPTISSVSPDAGALAGGTAVTITGTDFFTGAVVKFGGNICTGAVIGATSITCTLPAQVAGAATVTVTNPDLQIASAVAGYTYRPRPRVTSIFFNAGALAGGTTVTITGTGFVNLATATIGGSACTTPVVVNATTLTCVTPANLAGIYAVAVTNSDGQIGTLNSLFTYQAAPTVTSVSPTGGKLAGGTTITITGTGFKTALTAKVGGVTCTSPTFISSTSMTCILPAGTAGAKSIVITNADAQTGTLAAAYTYRAAPTITSISPSVGPLAGGVTITLTGTGFLTAPTITVGGVTCTVPTYVSATSATCITPLSTAGVKQVVITNSDLQPSVSAVSYTYQPVATVSNIVPGRGPATGGTPLTITGTGFVTGAVVRIGGTISCTPVTFVSSTQLTCPSIAKAAGTYTVSVTNADGQAGTPASSFIYAPAPTVTSVSQNKGPLAGGTNVTVTGTGFVVGATVSFGGSACGSVSLISPTSITCTTTAHAVGAVTVTVTNPDTQFGSAAAAFTYQAAPTVTSVAPLNGSQAGGTAVTITGTGFYAGITAKFGNSACTSPVYVNATTMTCTTPANAAGVSTVSVLNTDSQTGATAAAYTYTSTPALNFLVGVSSPTPPDPDGYGSTVTNITHTFTLQNTGDGTSSVITMSITGADPAAWSIGTDNCSTTTLVAGGSCTVQLTFLGAFLPSAAYSAILNADGAGGEADTNAVTGTVP